MAQVAGRGALRCLEKSIIATPALPRCLILLSYSALWLWSGTAQHFFNTCLSVIIWNFFSLNHQDFLQVLESSLLLKSQVWSQHSAIFTLAPTQALCVFLLCPHSSCFNWNFYHVYRIIPSQNKQLSCATKFFCFLCKSVIIYNKWHFQIIVLWLSIPDLKCWLCLVCSACSHRGTLSYQLHFEFCFLLKSTQTKNFFLKEQVYFNCKFEFSSTMLVCSVVNYFLLKW